MPSRRASRPRASASSATRASSTGAASSAPSTTPTAIRSSSWNTDPSSPVPRANRQVPSPEPRRRGPAGVPPVRTRAPSRRYETPEGTVPAMLPDRQDTTSMNVTDFVMTITSERPGDLFRFYRDVVALPPAPEFGSAVRAAGAVITFHAHSQVRGGAKEPQRHFTSLKVEDLSA